jgi:ElaB/YqjD/DUF883 family membrane-anchored ribosome-binding protein
MERDDGRRAIGGEGVPEGYLASPESRRGQRRRELVERVRGVPERINDVNERFVDFVREKPLVALGAACAVGYVLGRLLRRVV